MNTPPRGTAQGAEAGFLRSVLDDQAEMVIRSDAGFRILFCNRAACRGLGRPEAALIGTRFLPGPAGAAAAAGPDDPAWDSLQPLGGDADPRWISWSHRALFDAAGQPAGYLSVGRDVTARHLAHEALATSEAQLSALVENAPVAVYLKDGDGRYVMVNAEGLTYFGLPKERIVGSSARAMGPPEAADRADAADAEVRRTRRPMRAEYQMMAEGEPYHHAMVLRFPVAAPDGNGLWIGGFAIDITARKLAEAELARSREALNQSEKLNAMGSLLAGVAHELNNPLAIIVGQAAMLEEDAADGPLFRRAERIRRAADRCSRIVQTFLGLARRKPAERRAISLNDCIAAVIELLAYSLRSAGVELELDLAPDLAPIEGDPDLLHQVVMNLLVNAQQALEPLAGPRRVRICTRAEGTDVLFEISDSGPGVPPDIRQRIFEPFFTTKPQGVGTGVGLSFCHSVVAAHGGTLVLLDMPGPGARFRVTLPCAAGVAVPGGGDAGPAAAGHARALVVDDERELAETLAEMLAAEGYAVDVAASAALAQELIGGADYDLVLSDLRMPDLDGPAFFAWLGAEHPALARRCAFVTGDALGAAAARFLAEAGRPVLEKPFSRASVLRIAALARGG